MKAFSRAMMAIFFFSVPVYPATVFAKAPPEAEAMLRFAKFKSWDDVTADLEAKFPATIVKEFKGVVSDLPFPTIRVEKKNLVLVDSVSGRQWKFALGKDGTATLNGEKLRIRLLETVDAEVLRLVSENQSAVKAGARTSMLLRIFPEAIAAPAGGASTAAAAYAGAQVHKANACAGGAKTKELQQDCGVMGAPRPLTPGEIEAIKKRFPMLPIGIKCPSENNGVMEVIKKNGQGVLGRWRTVFDDILPTRMTMEGADRGGRFELLADRDPSKIPDGPLKDKVLAVNLETYYLFDQVCAPGKAKALKRYREVVLEGNKKVVAAQMAEQFPQETSSLKNSTTVE
jgi:hypothetical protein